MNIHTLSFVLGWYLESPPQAEGGHVPDAISWPRNRPPNNLKLTIPGICEIAPKSLLHSSSQWSHSSPITQVDPRFSGRVTIFN